MVETNRPAQDAQNAQPIFGLVWQMGTKTHSRDRTIQISKDEQVAARQIVPKTNFLLI